MGGLDGQRAREGRARDPRPVISRDRAAPERRGAPVRPARVRAHLARDRARHRLGADDGRSATCRRARRRRRSSAAFCRRSRSRARAFSSSGAASTMSRSRSRISRIGRHAFDYFHINSIDEDHDGNLLVSARNTWAVYKIDRHTGNVMWRLGGKKSDFAMGKGTTFAWQHDARHHGASSISLFDDCGGAAGGAAIARARDRDRHGATCERRSTVSTSIVLVRSRMRSGACRCCRTATCSSAGGPSPTSPSTGLTARSTSTPSCRRAVRTTGHTACRGSARPPSRRG